MNSTTMAVRVLRTTARKGTTDPLFGAVAKAREANLTWAQIAEALDVSLATAKARYSGGKAGLEARRAAARERPKRRPVVRVPEPEWPGVSLAEAAIALGVSTETVRRRIHAGAIRGGFELDHLGRRALRATEDLNT